jgi:hypothetical protein
LQASRKNVFQVVGKSCLAILYGGVHAANLTLLLSIHAVYLFASPLVVSVVGRTRS